MNAPVDLDHRALAYSMPLDKIDVSDPRLYYDDVWQPYFERLRREDPVHYTPESPYGPYWAVTKYRDIVQVEVNHKVFSSSDEVGGIMINDAPKGMERTSFIRMDPPEHDEQRREVSSTVNPITLAKMESLIRERTNMVLDGLPRGETFNWVERVSIELTSMMLATLFDYPIEDKAKLIRWSDTFICDINAPDAPVHSEEERFAEQMRFAEHMNEIWEERAKKPKSFDVISIMAHGEATSKMTLRQRMGILILFLVGGNDTTRNSMSGGLLGLSRFPEQFRKLRENPELVTSAVSEIVRWQTPVIHMRRTAMEDAEIGGKPIKAGDKVVVWYISGNRDEEQIERADEFIVDRKRPREHMSFGFGIHRCLGNRLAELQLRILWEEVLRRDLQIEVVDKPVYAYEFSIRTSCTRSARCRCASPPDAQRRNANAATPPVRRLCPVLHRRPGRHRGCRASACCAGRRRSSPQDPAADRGPDAWLCHRGRRDRDRCWRPGGATHPPRHRVRPTRWRAAGSCRSMASLPCPCSRALRSRCRWRRRTASRTATRRRSSPPPSSSRRASRSPRLPEAGPLLRLEHNRISFGHSLRA